MCPRSLLSCQRNPVNRSRARRLTEIRWAPLIIKPRVIATALQDLKPSTYRPQTVKNTLSQTAYFNTSWVSESTPVVAAGKVTLCYDWAMLHCWIFHALCLACSGGRSEKPEGRGHRRVLYKLLLTLRRPLLFSALSGGNARDFVFLQVRKAADLCYKMPLLFSCYNTLFFARYAESLADSI